MIAALVAGSMGAVSPAPASTQEAPEERERDSCRCVDRDGNELGNCVCVRMPRMDRIVMGPWANGLDRPRLGISVDMSLDGAEAADGARVADVMEDGPADRAGLREGDVVTRVRGRSLLESIGAEQEDDFDLERSLPAQRLLALARELEPGDEVEIEYLRDGTRHTATLEAEELAGWGRTFSFVAPEWDAEEFEERMHGLADRMRALHRDGPVRAPRAPGAPPPGAAYRFWMDGPDGEAGGRVRVGPGRVFISSFGRTGLELVELNPELGSYFGVERGVLVAEVSEESGLGLRPGDVVLAIDGRSVSEPARVHEILSTYDEDEEIALRVRRDGADIDVMGRIGG